MLCGLKINARNRSWGGANGLGLDIGVGLGTCKVGCNWVPATTTGPGVGEGNSTSEAEREEGVVDWTRSNTEADRGLRGRLGWSWLAGKYWVGHEVKRVLGEGSSGLTSDTGEPSK